MTRPRPAETRESLSRPKLITVLLYIPGQVPVVGAKLSGQQLYSGGANTGLGIWRHGAIRDRIDLMY